MSEAHPPSPVPPPPPSLPDPVKVGFAVQWIPNIISQGMASFTDIILSGNGTDVFREAWNQLSELNHPEESRIAPIGIEVEHFAEDSRLIVVIRFLPANLTDEPIFGVVVTGPCHDPSWSEESRASLSHRYFVLFRGSEGTYIEEWTMDPPLFHGGGLEPDRRTFIGWVLDHAVRGEETQPANSPQPEPEPETEPEMDVTSAIERARSELPAAVRRFVAGELEEFSVKVAIKDDDTTEHFWLAQTAFEDGYLCGVIDSEPRSVSNVQRGDSIRASGEHIVDFMYVANGKSHGNYTRHVLPPANEPASAAKLPNGEA